MVHHAGPVLPSLQNLPVECTLKRCNWKTTRPQMVFHDHRMIRCDTRFHTCTRIENTSTNEFDMSPDPALSTVWQTSNFHLVSTLLIEFFLYFSQNENLNVSIISGEKGLMNYPLKPRDRDIVVQDPFLTTRNVAWVVITVFFFFIKKKRLY